MPRYRAFRRVNRNVQGFTHIEFGENESMRLRSLLIGTIFVAAIVSAQEAPPQEALPQDPPSRVARLNLINGQVSFQPASLDTWTSATLNYPLTTGDHLYTDTDSQAELHIGPNAIRLNAHTNFGFLNLDDRTVQMRFTEGGMEVRVRALSDQDAYEIDTPNGAISLLRPGDYRVDTDPERNASMVTVFSGEVEITANGTSFAVHPRQTAYFGEGGAPDIRAANPPDEFDRFTGERNVREERLPPPQHVPQSMIGYEDLSAYGTWSEVPEYGWVWAPPVQAGWAPYHHGHWAWVEPWGWTWIDEAPWGFAPFHYGRWAFAGGGWIWVPGAIAVRPVYAPALVAFVGGPRFSVGIGIGGGIGAVAWFPLGPREVYRPAYRVSNTYITNVNITHVTNVTNITNVTNVRYVNQNVQGAVTAVPQSAFTTARPVAAASVRVTPQQMAQGQVVGAAPSVAPQRESLLGPNAGVNVARPSQAVMARQVVARATPPPAPVSFQARQAVIAQNQGRPLAPEQVAQLRQQQPAAVVNPAPVRAANVPAARANPVAPNAAAPNPAAQSQPSPNRLDSRPPNARPLNSPAPAPAPASQQPAYNRPAPAAEARPAQAPRPAGEARPAPPANRPAGRPAPKKEEERKEDRR
jgi:hypothetical protein